MDYGSEGFVQSIERFKPHAFHSKDGDGLYISHSHPCDELTLITAGEGYYSSPDQNIKVGEGDLILIPSGLHHGFVCVEQWSGVSIHVEHHKLPNSCQYLFQSELEQPRIHHARLAADDLRWAAMSCDQLERERNADEPDSGSGSLMRVAFETLLLLYQRNANEARDAARPADDKSFVREVLKDIHSGYQEQLTVGELADKHYVSESSLRKKFAEEIGVSPKQYIIKLRVKEAQRLLRQTNKAIESISAEVGFTSSSRFYHFFNKAVGVTPLEWRKFS
ncbi:MAG: transcriptional regulator, AraC family [Paenibacillus sp.]|nr:transcriptional regulator, AraC family [Paenibacillus sp.]